MGWPQGFDPAALDLSIDIDGQWRHQEVTITHPRIIALLYLSMEKRGEGYFICADNLCVPVRIADCPFVVLSVRHLEMGVQLLLTDGSYEFLAPETLSVDVRNVPRCLVKDKLHRARFSRQAWNQLAEAIHPDGEEGYLLRAGAKEYPMRLLDE